ncbi:MAG: glutathione S-transferase family protein [Burkholderiaceae bacterium]
MMKLFGHPDSGHAYKVRFFLTAAAIPHQYEVADIWADRQSRQPEFKEHSRYGEVPLLIDGAHSLVQSNAILLYLADRSGQWGAQDPDTLQTVREWLFWEANKIGLCLPQLRAHQMFDTARLSEGAHQWLSERYAHDVGLLDKALSEGSGFIIGDQPTVADFSLSAYLFYADQAKVSVPPNVQHWLNALARLPGWQPPETLLA